jgi:hypothetical protein
MGLVLVLGLAWLGATAGAGCGNETVGRRRANRGSASSLA